MVVGMCVESFKKSRTPNTNKHFSDLSVGIKRFYDCPFSNNVQDFINPSHQLLEGGKEMVL